MVVIILHIIVLFIFVVGLLLLLMFLLVWFAGAFGFLGGFRVVAEKLYIAIELCYERPRK